MCLCCERCEAAIDCPTNQRASFEELLALTAMVWEFEGTRRED